MMRKIIPVAFLTVILGFGLPSIAQITDAAKQTGQAVGQAGKDAAKTTVETGKAVGSAAKEGAQTVGNEAKRTVTNAPKGATGMCKDGSYTKAKTKRGACSKHGGIAKWY
jgi:hypothetical protein